MKIRDILQKGRPTLSFEIFPPKTGAALAPVMEAAAKTAALKPDFMSVTYGAGGGTTGNSVRIASYIQNELGVTAIAHLTCVAAPKAEIKNVVEALRLNNVENILALRGDIPPGTEFPHPDRYNYAYELVRAVREIGDFSVGGACYPEGHMECPHISEDLKNLKLKADSGCDFLTTQMFFDNSVFYKFLFRLRDLGVKTPVLAGIMPVTNGKQISRMCKLAGADLPPRLKALVDRYSDSPSAMKQAGIAYATEQIIDLLAGGADGVHVYSMNSPEVAAKIAGNISEIIKV